MTNPFEHATYTLASLETTIIMDLEAKINYIYITLPLYWDSAKVGDFVHTNTTNPTSILPDLMSRYLPDVAICGNLPI